ncbi:MAG: hypothetical protein CVU84_14605 [Firmicutes bacterium HGW-Firmicutes-1]|jgi:alpha-beta hydrolase superfamily lysophospholipase|nr:MAG: hypothetical protein CVU84_14605 [Firmicutes bacterium HGW-Firmicutes-1]
MVRSFNERIINIKTKNGDVIHSVYNYFKENTPLIIIPPQFEKTIRTNLTLMIYLINNGFNVLRYDNRYHNGNSTGDIEDYNLKTALEDLEIVIQYVKSDSSIYNNNGIGLLGVSITSRIIYRYLSDSVKDIDVFLTLVGVVNMQYTLNSIIGFDIVDEVIKEPKKIWGTRKVIKYPVNWDNFIKILINENMHNLETANEDIQKIKTPIYIIASEDDKWVDIEEYEKAFITNKEILKGVYKLPGAGHELYKNPEAAKFAAEQIVKVFQEFWGIESEQHIIKPTITDIIAHNKKERVREKQYENVG